ncbi:hypothetical protein M8818_003767 [Zalaria obscura]|uniref:Uncharacterized protein n=1 Tax=Zalaria obscura TaxID=2024903 RepID=A0ACC3SEB2_9PEZI
MSWTQKQFALPSKSRGSYLITDTVLKELPEIKDYKVGLINLFVQHTSCALSLNENWDEDVREDMSDALDRIAPEDRKGNLYRHSAEGLDDMPAHIKSALVGASVTIPIQNGRLATGTWQGIWYLEFRSSKHTRSQYTNGTTAASVPPPSGISYPNPTGVSTSYATKSYNASAASTYLVQTDFSDERLALLWDQVGPIATGPVTTTVSPTPEPSKFASPGVFHPYIPSYEPGLNNVTLPANFIWGVASSAFQVEGAANAEGKGPSIWDLLSHRVPNEVADNTTADVVAEHYYLYKQDFARLKALGIPAFSPSISWPRIFPFGKGPINEAGVAHYDDVIAELVKNGIKPAVTLFHWDTPLALFDEYGGWTDRQIIDDYFNYATFIIQRYDEYVGHWFTINEPQYCNW